MRETLQVDFKKPYIATIPIFNNITVASIVSEVKDILGSRVNYDDDDNLSQSVRHAVVVICGCLKGLNTKKDNCVIELEVNSYLSVCSGDINCSRFELFKHKNHGPFV